MVVDGASGRMRALFEHHDFSDVRRIFVAGDIHGSFDKLREKIAEVGFDPGYDRLILLGDLVDRGPNSLEAIEWCDRPGIRRVLGNHEDLLAAAARDERNGLRDHLRNGGSWFRDIDDEAERRCWADTLLDAPVAMEIITPAGRRVGFVHADVPTNDWEKMVDALTSDSPQTVSTFADACIWDRTRFRAIRDHLKRGHPADFEATIAGIDHVFFGHSIVSEPRTIGNCSWIDTGAYKEGRDLTLVEVDEWIASLDSRGPA